MLLKKKGKRDRLVTDILKKIIWLAFDRPVSWAKNVHIRNWVHLHVDSEDLDKWNVDARY